MIGFSIVMKWHLFRLGACQHWGQTSGSTSQLLRNLRNLKQPIKRERNRKKRVRVKTLLSKHMAWHDSEIFTRTLTCLGWKRCLEMLLHNVTCVTLDPKGHLTVPYRHARNTFQLTRNYGDCLVKLAKLSKIYISSTDL